MVYKVVMLGGGGVGKSAITIQFVNNKFIADYDPTIENSYRRQFTCNDEEIMLDILDTAGQEEFSAIRDSSIREGNGFLIVYSIISRDSLIEVPGFVERVLQVKDRDTYPMVLLGNKCDLKDRVISQQEGEREASRFNIPYIECSAKSRINIDEAFEKISEAIVEAHRKGFYEAQTGSSFVPEVNKPRKGCTLL